MKTKWARLIHIVDDKKNAIAVLAIVIVAIFLFIYFPDCRCAVISGFFTVAAVIATALFALKKYHSEQRTSRLQRIYFDDTFLGQAKSIEEMMSQTTKNMLLIENLYNLVINILKRSPVNIEIIKKDIENLFLDTKNSISVDIDTADFKKETISILLNDAGIKGCSLPSWIKKFQDDAYRFSSFLKSQLVILEPDVLKLKNSNFENYKKYLNEILGQYVQDNYVLIRRHYILFSLFSELALALTSANYATVEDIFSAFHKNKVKKIVNLINDSYKGLIVDCSGIDIGAISSEQSARLDEKIKCAGEKIARDL